MSLRIRRGVSTDIPTPLEGELLYTTDNGNLYVGFYDQTQDAVIPKLTSASLVDDSSPTLSADLQLSGNNIVGTGNINIDGTITATGSINLGDGVEDNVIVGGQIGSDLIPNSENAYDLGTQNVTWRNGYFGGIFVNGELQSDTLKVDNILSADSTSFYNSQTDTLTTSIITADAITADLVGSVFSDDSLVLVDSVDSSLNLSEMRLAGSSIQTINDFGLTVTSSDPNGKGFLKIDSNQTGYNFRINALAGSFTTETAPGHLYNVSKGTLDNPLPIEPGDFLHLDVFSGYDGSQNLLSSAILTVVDPNKTTAVGEVPGKIVLSTFTDGNIANSKACSLDSDGNFAINHSDPVNFVARDTLDVNGGGIFNQSITAPSITGSVIASDSTVIIDADTNQITGKINELNVLGTIENPSNNIDSLNPVEWLRLQVNGETRYLPLYS